MEHGPTGPPTVLFVLNAVEKFFSHRAGLADGLSARGYRVEVATPAEPGDRRIGDAGHPLHPIPLRRRGLTPWHLLRTTAALARLYRRRKPDVVHHFTPKPVIYGGIAARLAGVPAAVHSIAGLDYPFAVRSPLARLLRLLATVGYRLALDRPNTRLIFENRDDLEVFVRRGLTGEARCHVILGAGVDTSRFRPIEPPDGPVTVLLAARMLEQKGVREFVDAARRLRRQGVHARFVLAGGTDPANPTSIPARRIRAWQASGPVEWLGEVDHDRMPELLGSSHVVCLPSYREGAPKTLIEAAACGRPAVATDVPGCRAVVRHGDTGLLVPPRDSAALAGALRTLVADEERRRHMGRRSRERALDEFSLEHVVDATAEVYQELLARAPPRARSAA